MSKSWKLKPVSPGMWVISRPDNGIDCLGIIRDEPLMRAVAGHDDLLAACKELARHATATRDSGSIIHGGEYHTRLCDLISDAEAAIAKATPEQTKGQTDP